MSEMVERVARAMFARENRARDGWTWEREIENVDLRTYWLDSARAAIAALREPTEAMLMAAREDSGAYTSNAEQDCEPYLEAWQEMIDAALGDG